jgi:hypothetical protein
VTDPVTGKTLTQPVIAVWLNHDTHLMDITISAHGVTSTIHATQHHLFWDATHHAWTEAAQLTPGDQLTTADGSIATVAGTAVIPGAADMWDLTIANTHDFYVTASVNTSPSGARLALGRADINLNLLLKGSAYTSYADRDAESILAHNCKTGEDGPNYSTSHVKAGDLAGKYTEGQSTRDPASQWYHEELTNEELMDGVNNADEGDGITVSRSGKILGGHHR